MPTDVTIVTGPVRTCVGCRQRAAKHQLLRVVVGDRGQGPEALPDPAGRAPGRGAHLHPTTECLDLALRRRALPRALRAPGPLGTEALREQVSAADGPAPPAPPADQPVRDSTDRRWSSSS